MTKRNDVYNVTLKTHSDQSEKPKVDSIVQTIIDRFESRAAFGKQKYGTDLDRTDLSVVDWLEHFQMELMDGILYCEKLKQVLNGKVEKSNK